MRRPPTTTTPDPHTPHAIDTMTTLHASPARPATTARAGRDSPGRAHALVSIAIALVALGGPATPSTATPTTPVGPAAPITSTSPAEPARPAPPAGRDVAAPAATDAADSSAITFTYVNALQVELFESAVDRFERAGLELPPVDVVGSRTDPVCTHGSAAHRFEDGRSRIIVCGPEAGPTEELVFLHELAHAWDHHQLTDDRRREFLEVRGLEHWRGDDVRWNERGAEHAADIIAWALVERVVHVTRLVRNGCEELRLGYRTLTGTEPPRSCPVT